MGYDLYKELTKGTRACCIASEEACFPRPHPSIMTRITFFEFGIKDGFSVIRRPRKGAVRFIFNAANVGHIATYTHILVVFFSD